jgi:hypothetical protein
LEIIKKIGAIWCSAISWGTTNQLNDWEKNASESMWVGIKSSIHFNLLNNQ